MTLHDHLRRIAGPVVGLILFACGDPGNDPLPPALWNKQCVVLLHGLARTSQSMQQLADSLETAGYHSVNLDYPSRKKTIEALAAEVVPEGVEQCAGLGTERIHFVTHSMGGILLRYYLAGHAIDRLGKVVMLSPPNHGSEITDALRDNFIYRWINGPAGLQLGTDRNSIPMRLGPADYPLGIITGRRNSLFDAWFAALIPGVDDGKVSVESAKLEGMADFLVVPGAHSFIMSDEEVIAQSIHFLRHGCFRCSGTGRHCEQQRAGLSRPPKERQNPVSSPTAVTTGQP